MATYLILMSPNINELREATIHLLLRKSKKLYFLFKFGGNLKHVNVDYCQPQARLKPKRCLGGFIFTINNNNNK